MRAALFCESADGFCTFEKFLPWSAFYLPPTPAVVTLQEGHRTYEARGRVANTMIFTRKA